MFNKLNLTAMEQLLKWEHLLQDSSIDIFIEAFEFIF